MSSAHTRNPHCDTYGPTHGVGHAKLTFTSEMRRWWRKTFRTLTDGFNQIINGHGHAKGCLPSGNTSLIWILHLPITMTTDGSISGLLLLLFLFLLLFGHPSTALSHIISYNNDQGERRFGVAAAAAAFMQPGEREIRNGKLLRSKYKRKL